VIWCEHHLREERFMNLKERREELLTSAPTKILLWLKDNVLVGEEAKRIVSMNLNMDKKEN